MGTTSTGTALGARSYQEDRLLTLYKPEGIVFVVADGHGDARCVSKLVAAFGGVWDEVYVDTKPFGQIYSELYSKLATLTNNEESGCTLSVVFMAPEQAVAQVAILGDSPVIIKRPDGTLWVSPEHNVRTNMVERELADRRGGHYGGGYVWNGYGDYARGLQMSRALGDSHMGSILSRIPEMIEVPVGEWVLLGSDGLVDPGHTGGEEASSPEKMGALIDGGSDAEELVQYAVDVPTHDNATAILWRRS